MLREISANTGEVIENMGDIIWSMKPLQNEENPFDTRIRNYGSSLLTIKNITCTYDIDPAVERNLKNMYIRKNILLISKEAINNVAKYSDATFVSVTLALQEKTIVLKITDNGKGFDNNNPTNGNGLQNMTSRARSLGGALIIDSQPGTGCSIIVNLPITNFSDR
jgi:signal transduction histidine kinase